MHCRIKESQVKTVGFGWILVLRTSQSTLISKTGNMKVSSKIPAAANKQIPAVKAPTSKKDTKETAQGAPSRKATSLPGNSKLGSKQMPPNPELNNILRADKHGSTMTLRRSYGMLVSGFAHVAKKQQLTSEAAEQFAKTVDIRIRELYSESISKTGT